MAAARSASDPGRQLLHQLRARREARRVLIDVVRRAVEVRDARPRHPRQLVVVERVAVVRLQQPEVDLAERVGGDGLPFLDQPVRLQLVVGEQHLRVERPDDAVDGVLQQHDALALVAGALSMYSRNSTSLSVDGTSATKIVYAE